MEAERAERLTAWGPEARLRTPGGFRGQRPGSFWVLAFVKGQGRFSWKLFVLSVNLNLVQKGFNNGTAHCVD